MNLTEREYILVLGALSSSKIRPPPLWFLWLQVLAAKEVAERLVVE